MIRDGQEGFGMKPKKVFLKKVIDERQEAELNRLLSGGYHLGLLSAMGGQGLC